MGKQAGLSGRMRGLVAGTLGWMLVACGGASADVLRLTDGSQKEGTFEGYRNGRFEFRLEDGKRVRAHRSTVKDLLLTPAAAVSVEVIGRSAQPICMEGYARSEFYGSVGDVLQKYKIDLVKAVTPELDFSRVEESGAVTAVADSVHAQVPSNLLVPGKVTVVQFHVRDSLSSVRQGNYLDMLSERNRNALAHVKVEVSGLEDEQCLSRGITTLPQFWFYDRSGHEVTRLTERYTENDIDEALKRCGVTVQ